MSSILLSNPFTPPAPAAAPSGTEPSTALAVTPAQAASGSAGTGDSSSFSGRGSEHGGGNGALAMIAKARNLMPLERPVDATPGSVVNAQAQEPGASPFGLNLPKVEMPDPLPTSPFLKRA